MIQKLKKELSDHQKALPTQSKIGREKLEKNIHELELMIMIEQINSKHGSRAKEHEFKGKFESFYEVWYYRNKEDLNDKSKLHEDCFEKLPDIEKHFKGNLNFTIYKIFIFRKQKLV